MAYSEKLRKSVLQLRSDGLSYRAIALQLCRDYGYPIISYGTAKRWVDDEADICERVELLRAKITNLKAKIKNSLHEIC